MTHGTYFTDSGQLVVPDSFIVYPARWNQVHAALGSIRDHFSVSVQRIGDRWFIPGPGIAFSQQRWSFERADFVAAHTFGPDTLTDDLDTALGVATYLAETRTNIQGETFAQVARRLLDDPDPNDPDVIVINERKARA
jgi:hypothetical protein